MYKLIYLIVVDLLTSEIIYRMHQYSYRLGRDFQMVTVDCFLEEFRSFIL